MLRTCAAPSPLAGRSGEGQGGGGEGGYRTTNTVPIVEWRT